MLSEQLDIRVEFREGYIWFYFSGVFEDSQISVINNRLRDFIDSGNRKFIINLEEVSEISSRVARMFLNLLNDLNGKNGDLKLVFRNLTVSQAFSEYRNIFQIYPNEKSIKSSGIINKILRRGILMSRRTGVRFSIPVAVFIMILLIGLYASLLVIIKMQHSHIRKQEVEIHNYRQWKTSAESKIEGLEKKLKPLKQLGIYQDTAKGR